MMQATRPASRGALLAACLLLRTRVGGAREVADKKMFVQGIRPRYMFNRMVKYSAKTLDRTFGALADPTRRRILAQLASGDRCVTDLARPYDMSLPAISKHLRVLEKAGLLRRRRLGRVHEMKLRAEPLREASQWVEEYRKFWEGSLDRLAAYLEKTKENTKKKERSKL